MLIKCSRASLFVDLMIYIYALQHFSICFLGNIYMYTDNIYVIEHFSTFWMMMMMMTMLIMMMMIMIMMMLMMMMIMMVIKLLMMMTLYIIMIIMIIISYPKSPQCFLCRVEMRAFTNATRGGLRRGVLL